MTVTNDERRKVVARLRDFENLRSTFEDSVLCGFLEALDVGYLNWEGVCTHLANLVEPEPERTCHVVQTIRYDYDGYAGTEYVTELSCGHKYTDSYGGGPDYCPWCGAKVID